MISNKAKFGLSLSNRSVMFDWLTLSDLLDAAELAEKSGLFHGIWVGDNLLSKPRIDSIVTLSAIATRTKSVKLGTICLASFPLRHPIPLAIQWASLDVLSEGRTILAVCNGGGVKEGPQFSKELEVMGVASGERVGRVIEGIEILRRLWSEESVDHHGKFYDFTDVKLLPKPYQSDVPIFIAANPRVGEVDEERIDKILRRVAKYGDGWQADSISVDVFRERCGRLAEYVTADGRDASKFESCLHIMVNINEDHNKARSEADDYLSLYYGKGYMTPERVRDWVAYGSPAEVYERIQEYVEAGCTMPVLRFVSPNLKLQLNRCINEVLPMFGS